MTEKRRGNNFSVLRVLFAGLVIASHAPEIIDHNRSREILTRCFGTLSFGEVAVDGFFLVSGYLITKSFLDNPQLLSYLIKRVARIFPAFLVNYWLLALALSPFVGAAYSAYSSTVMRNNLVGCFELGEVYAPGAFKGLPWPNMNGVVWTIAYEFRCYLAVAVVGLLMKYLKIPKERIRWPLLLVLMAALAYNGFHAMGTRTADPTAASATNSTNPSTAVNADAQRLGAMKGAMQKSTTGRLIAAIPGGISTNIRLLSVFGVGALFYLFSDRVRLNGKLAILAATLIPLCLFSTYLAEAGFALCGGYLIFWFALRFRPLALSAITDRNDVSYGLYLWAWPLSQTFLYFDRGIGPIALGIYTFVGASLLGFASWHVLEKRVLDQAHIFARRFRVAPIKATV